MNTESPKDSPTKIWRKLGHLRQHINLNTERYYESIDKWRIVEVHSKGEGIPMMDVIKPETLMKIMSS